MSDATRVARWYTRALKIPILIGRLPSGEYLWRGPYTLSQAISAGAALLLCVSTMSWWGPLELFGRGIVGFLGNWVAAAGCAVCVGWVGGRIAKEGSHPLHALVGATSLLTASRTGVWGGAPLPTGRPHQRRCGRVHIGRLPPPAATVGLRHDVAHGCGQETVSRSASAQPAAAAAAPTSAASVTAVPPPGVSVRGQQTRRTPQELATPSQKLAGHLAGLTTTTGA